MAAALVGALLSGLLPVAVRAQSAVGSDPIEAAQPRTQSERLARPGAAVERSQVDERSMRELIGKLPEDLKNDPSVAILREAAKENTVTVVHLIYRSKNYESSSKDYDFSHVGMVEHWSAGERDVHLSMRHKDWLQRPQSGETMVTYDLTGDGTETPNGKQE